MVLGVGIGGTPEEFGKVRCDGDDPHDPLHGLFSHEERQRLSQMDAHAIQ
jgi:hypothetical protein